MPFSKDFVNSQRETYFWLKPDAPQNQCLFWTFFVWHNAPKMDAFMKDVLNVKPVLLKQNAPEMDAFQQRLFNFSVKPIFCWNLSPPKPMPFMSKMLSTLNLFCLTQCPQNRCQCERCSQCEASSFKAKCTRNGCLSAKTFLILSVKPMPPKPMSKMLSTLNLFCLTQCLSAKSKIPPKWMPFSKDFLILSVKPIFCWNLMPPKTNAFETLNLFCLTMPPK